jgi:hypothetical protein
MSIGFILGGVPVKVMVPLIVPAAASGKAPAPMSEAATAISPSEAKYLVRIVSLFLEV